MLLSPLRFRRRRDVIGAIVLCVVIFSGSEAQVQVCDTDITFTANQLSSEGTLDGYAAADAMTSGWCADPDAEGSTCLQVQLADLADLANLTNLQTLRTITFSHISSPGGDYMSSWDMEILFPQAEDYVRQWKDMSSLSATQYTVLTINPGVVFQGFRICPRSYVGLPCFKFEATGCPNEQFCQSNPCQAEGVCTGPNYCVCPKDSGFYGPQCQYTAETLQTVEVTFEDATIAASGNIEVGGSEVLTIIGASATTTVSIVDGYTAQALYLSGSGLYATRNDLGCFGDLETSCTSFTLSLAMSITFDASDSTFAILGSNHLANRQGVSVTVEQGVLYVKVFAGDYLWEITAPNFLVDECSLPKVVGDCEAIINRWYYNSRTGECLPFNYGGCDGNSNNFESQEECEGACSTLEGRRVTLISGAWFRFLVSWTSGSGLEVLVNNKLVGKTSRAVSLEPLASPPAVPATDELYLCRSPLLTESVVTNVKLGSLQFWPISYTEVLETETYTGVCDLEGCSSLGSTGCYDNTTCSCRNGFMGASCEISANSNLLQVLTFESIESGILTTTLGAFTVTSVTLNTTVDGLPVLAFIDGESYVSADFDMGCLGDLSCPNGFTFSIVAIFNININLNIFSIYSAETGNLCDLRYSDSGELTAEVVIEGESYLATYMLTSITGFSSYEVSYSAQFGLQILIDGVVVAVPTQVEASATVTYTESFSLTFGSRTTTGQGSGFQIQSCSYAGVSRTQLVNAGIAMKVPCAPDFCENGGVCSGVNRCACDETTEFKGARCDKSGKDDITIEALKGIDLVNGESKFSVYVVGDVEGTNGNAVEINTMSQSSYIDIDTTQMGCLSNLVDCFDGFTMGIDFSLTSIQESEETIVVLMSTGGDEQYSGYVLSYNYTSSEYTIVVQTYSYRWSLSVNYEVEVNRKYNIGFSWSASELVLFVDNVLIGSTTSYTQVETTITMTEQALRLGSCYTNMATRTYSFRIFDIYYYSSYFGLLSTFDVVQILREEEEDLAPCDSSPCEYGECINKGETFECECFPGYSGAVCNQSAAAYQIERFTFQSIKQEGDFYLAMTQSFPLKCRGRVKLVKEGNRKFISLTGAESILEISMKRLRKIKSIFTETTVDVSASFSFNFEFKMVVVDTEITTTRIILFSIGQLENGGSEELSTGMVVYYENGQVYVVLRLRGRRYEISFTYTLAQLQVQQSFDLSFQFDTGLFVRSKLSTATTYTVLASIATYTSQTYRAVEFEQAYIGFRGTTEVGYEMFIGRCGVGEASFTQIEAEGLTTELCGPNFCQNGGNCNGVDLCQCVGTFSGSDCSVSPAAVTEETSTFQVNGEGVITTSGGLSTTSKGDVTIESNVCTLTASTSGTYLEIDTAAVPCLSNLGDCAAGLTICADLTFTALVENSQPCLLSTGGKIGYGVSVTYDNDEESFTASVSVPFKSWYLQASYAVTLNTNYQVCLSWGMDDGIQIAVDSTVIGRTKIFQESFTREQDDNSENLRFGGCYGVVHTESWSFSVSEYTFYEASFQSLDQLNILSVTVPEPVPEVEPVCEVLSLQTSLTTIVSDSMALFSLAPDERAANCSSLTAVLTSAETSISGCRNQDDSVASSTSLSAILLYTVKPNIEALKTITERLCDDSATSPPTDDICDFVSIGMELDRFFSIASSSQLTTTTCQTVTDIQVNLTTLLDSCSETTKSALTSITLQMQLNVNSMCASATCNLDYSSSCVADATGLIEGLTDDNYTSDVCKQLKQSLTCFANHTIKCDSSEYRSLSYKLEDVRTTYMKNCFTKPPVNVNLDDCEAQVTDELDILHGLIVIGRSGIYSKDEYCGLLRQNDDLIRNVPATFTGARLANYTALQQIMWSMAFPCFQPSGESCTCDITTADGCMEEFRNEASVIDPSCGIIEEKLTCVRRNTNGCQDSDIPTADGIWSDVASLMMGSECKIPDEEICQQVSPLPCDVTQCKAAPDCELTGMAQCYSDNLVDPQCGDNLRAAGANELSTFFASNCSGDVSSIVDTIRGTVDPLASTFDTCLETYKVSAPSNFEETCTAVSILESCLLGATLTLDTSILAAPILNITRSLLDDVCTDVPDVSSCTDGPTAFTCFGPQFNLVILASLNDVEQADNLCGGVSPFETSCLDAVVCDEIFSAKLEKVQTWIRESERNICSVVTTEEADKGCNPQAAKACIRDIAPRVFAGNSDICSGMSTAVDCVKSNTQMCPLVIQKKFSMAMKSVKKLTSEQCCLQGLTSTCDPSAAVMCVLDINHMARLPTPDWKAICRMVNPSVACMNGFISTCDKCQKDTVSTIVETLNKDIVEVCLNPPVTKCRLTQALECVEQLKTFSILKDPEDIMDDFRCLKVKEAQQCIDINAEECDGEVRFTVNLELTKVIDYMGAKNCAEQDPTGSCMDVLRDRVQSIFNFDPRDPERMTCRIPYAAGPYYTDLDECEPDIKCDKGFYARHVSTLAMPEAEPQGGNGPDEGPGSESSPPGGDGGEETEQETEQEAEASTSPPSNWICVPECNSGELQWGLPEPGSKSQKSQEVVQAVAGWMCVKPSTKEKKGSNESSRKASEENSSEASKENSDPEESEENSNFKGSQEMERKVVYKNRFDQLCLEAGAAWKCAEHELSRKSDDTKSLLLLRTLQGLWTIASSRCEVAETDFQCYECSSEMSNEECNKNKAVCTDEQDVCSTRVRYNDERVMTSITKGCAKRDECEESCADGTCTYCCSGQKCNKNIEGPISPVCTVSYAAECVFKLAVSLSSSSGIDCTVFEAEMSCMKEVRKQCVSESHYEFFNMTEMLLQSLTFKQCLIQLAPPTCSIHSVTSLGLLLSNVDLNKEDVCSHYDATMAAVEYARETSGCSEELLKEVDRSMKFIRIQLQGFKCPSILGPRAYCENKEDVCDIKAAEECLKSLGPLIATARYADKEAQCRDYVRISVCLKTNFTDCTSVPEVIQKGAIMTQFESTTKFIADQCAEEIKAASCDPEDDEFRCSPMTAFNRCFRDFSLPNIFDECQNIALTKACIMQETSSCLPIQTKMVFSLLRLQPNMMDTMARCGFSDVDMEETPYTQVMKCIGEFTGNLKQALVSPRNSLANVCVSSFDIAQRCFRFMNLADMSELSPIERMYIGSAMNILIEIQKAVCTDRDEDVEVTVSAECQIGYERAARCLSVQTIGLITRPFAPLQDLDAFCASYSNIEVCVSSSLEVCTGDEVTSAMSTYLYSLRSFTYNICYQKLETMPKCEINIAEECLTQQSSYMQSGNVTVADQCRMVNFTLRCVKDYTFNCSAGDTAKVDQSVKLLINKYWQTCPALINPLICPEQQPDSCQLAAGVDACTASISSLSTSPSKFYEIESCVALNAISKCIKGISANCTDDELDAEYNAISVSVSTVIGGVALPCLDDLTVDALRPTCPVSPPTCSIVSAIYCLESRYWTFTGGDIKSVARNEAECVWKNISGCNDIQLQMLQVVVTQIFGTELTLSLPTVAVSPFDSLILEIITIFTAALSEPKYNLFDICFAAQTLADGFESIFMDAGVGALALEKNLIQGGRDGIKYFLDITCNDIDLVGPVIVLPDTEDVNCPKDSYVRNYIYILIESLFSGLLSDSDSKDICKAVTKMSAEAHSELLAPCSEGFRKQFQFASHLVAATIWNVCQSPPRVCNIEKTTHCISQIGLVVSQYGIDKTQEDVCATLRMTDKCIEQSTYNCVGDSAYAARARYSVVRMVAVDICGGIDEEAYIPKCKVRLDEYEDKCLKKEAEQCVDNFFMSVVSRPILSRGRQCAEFVEARQCLQRSALNCVEQGDQLSFKGYVRLLEAFFGEDQCDVEEYEYDCVAGCMLQEAELCVLSLGTKVKDARMSGPQSCSSISDGRICLSSQVWKCPAALKSRLEGKMDTVLRLANLHEVDCVNVYQCIATFEGVSASIFGFLDVNLPDPPEPSSEESTSEDTKEKNTKEVKTISSKESNESDESDGGSSESNKSDKGSSESDKSDKGSSESKDSKESKETKEASRELRPIEAVEPDLDLPRLYLRAMESWSCIQSGLNLLPSENRKYVNTVLTVVWEAIKYRTENTEPQRCYTCDGAESNGDCQDNIEVCEPHMQMCQNVIKQEEDGKVRYYKSCVRPSFREVACQTDDCRSYFCEGDLCNEAFDAENVKEPVTCHIEEAIECSLNLVRSFIDNGAFECRSIQLELNCMERLSRTCVTPEYQSISTIAVQILSSISEIRCMVKDVSNECGTKAILSTYAILKSGYTTVDDTVCNVVKETIGSVESIKDQGTCSPTSQIPVQQSLVLIKQQTSKYCGWATGDCSEEVTEEATPVQLGRPTSCPRNWLLDAAACLRENTEQILAVTPGTANTFCSGVDVIKPCMEDLRSCTLPASIESWVTSNNVSLSSLCPASDDVVPCQPKLCDTDDARSCFTGDVLADLPEGTVCSALRESKDCLSRKTSSCFSIQTISVNNDFEAVVMSLGSGCETEAVGMSVDIFTPLSTCLVEYAEAIKDALASSSMMSDMCTAYETSLTCKENVALPVLSSSFTLEPFENFNSAFGAYLEDKCGNEASSTSTCDLVEIGQLIMSFHLRSWTIANADPGNRQGYCRMLNEKLILATELVKDCEADKQELLGVLLNDDTFNNYCIPLLFEEETCDSDLVALSLEAIKQLTTSSLVSNDVLCSNSLRAMESTLKFTATCPGGNVDIALTTREYFGGLLGNSCPGLSVRLFCGFGPTENRSCDHELAETCLENIDLSIDAAARDDFCSVLQANVSCGRVNVDGCLKSQVETVNQTFQAIQPDIDNTPCSLEDSSTDYSDVCIALPTSSISNALRCLEDLLAAPYDMSDCTIAESKKLCIAALIQSTSSVQLVIVESLFRILLPSADSCEGLFPLATIPYFPGTIPPSVTADMTCWSDNLGNLVESLMAQLGPADEILCTLLTNNSTDCLQNTNTNLEDFIQQNCSGVASIPSFPGCTSAQRACTSGECIPLEQFCDGTPQCSDSSDEANCESGCDIREATYCVMSQLAQVMITQNLPLADKKSLCSLNIKAEQCVRARTSTCSDSVKDSMQAMLAYSNIILGIQGTCEEPQMCIVEQCIECINQLAVVVAAKTESASDTEALCTQYLETQSCIAKFSATCSDGDKLTVTTKMTAVEALIDEDCDAIDEPVESELICPDIPEEARLCNISNAFGCVLSSYVRLVSYNAANNWEIAKSCTSLQTVIRCVATNISGCSSESSAPVLNSLNVIRDSVKDRCIMYDTTLCGDSQPCSGEETECVKTFKSQLSSNPEDNVCGLITDARACITEKTMDCSPTAWAIADYYLNKAISEMKTQVRCDDSSADACILQFAVRARKILKSTNPATVDCEAVATAKTCITDKLVSTTMADGFFSIVNNIVNKVDEAVSAACTGTPSCPSDKSVDSLLDIMVTLTTTTEFNKEQFCTDIGLLLSQVDTTSLDDCNVGDSLTNLTSDLQTSFSVQCDTTLSCQQATQRANDCIAALTTTSTCSEVWTASVCVGQSIGQCPDIKDTTLSQFQTARNSVTNDCQLFPVISISKTSDNTIYMAEGGPSMAVSLSNLESNFMTGDVEIRVRIELDVDETTVPQCQDGSDISQVVTDKCSIVFSIDNIDIEETFELSPVVDNNIDGIQKVTATFVFEKFVDGNNVATFQVEPIEIIVQDRDETFSMCSSINDPHVTTLDKQYFNYMGIGTFLMFESNGPIKVKVQATFEMCGDSGSCNCGIDIQVDNDVIIFDRCGAAGEYIPMTITFLRQGDFTDAAKIMRSADSKIYQVVLATGQIIKIKTSDLYLNFWIMASANDKGNTKGLCGLFDGDPYNDLTLPDGSVYAVKDTDRDNGMLSPNDYTLQWEILPDSPEDISNGVQETLNDTIIGQVCTSCALSASTCGIFSRMSSCGLHRAGATDITESVKKMSLQGESIAAKRRRRRKKRQAAAATTPSSELSWPEGWNETSAENFCTEKIRASELNQKCNEAVQIINEEDDQAQSILNCMDDIIRSGGTDFIVDTNENLKTACLGIIDEDGTFVTNNEAKEVAKEILALSCQPTNCSGNGRCDEGMCRCNPGFLGSNCAYNQALLQQPIVIGLENYGLCEFSSSQDCTDVFITGRNFVESELLKCHIEFVEIDENGYRKINGNSVVLVTAELVTEETVRCQISTVKSSRTAALVAVSNDGSSTSQNQMFIAYDPDCQNCDHVSRKCYSKEDACHINGQCYLAGITASTNPNYLCNPNVSKNKWITADGMIVDPDMAVDDVEDSEEIVESEGLSQGSVIAIVVSCSFALITVLAVGIMVCYMRSTRMSRRKENQFREDARHEAYMNPAFQNPAYQVYDQNRTMVLTSSDMEPQDSFRRSRIHPRANMAHHDPMQDGRYH